MSLPDKCENIQIVLFDVDGVMTDGSIYINENGEFFKSFNVKDGLAIELLRSHNIITGVISGKSSLALTQRCEQLGFDEIVTGCKNKLPALLSICSKYSLQLDNVAFLGDDVLDIPIFDEIGISVAPSDAHNLALERADWITKSRGGEGMVREFTDELLINKLGLTLVEIYKPMLDKIKNDDVLFLEQ